MDVRATVIATIVSSIISSAVAWIVAVRKLRAQELAEMRGYIVKMIDLSIKYPHLENDTFCEGWPPTDKTSVDAMRYDNYCCLVFNLIQQAWDYFKGNHEKIRRFLYVQELIIRHRKWWRSEALNQYAYKTKFRDFVNSFIEGMQ